jgi:hypothetical protein
VSKPADKVQIYKRESTAGGGDPSDNDDFYQDKPLDPSEDAPEVQGVFFQDATGGQANDEDVYAVRNGDDLVFRDKTVGAEVTLNDLYAGAGGLSEVQHSALRQLIHFINEGPAEGFATGAYKEILPAGSPFPTSVIWWESAAKTQKIVEKTLTYNGVSPSQIQWKMYDVDGTTVLTTVTDSITYINNVFESSRTRAIA